MYWQGNPTDGGSVTETSWDAVTIAWDNGHVARVLRGDMREIQISADKAVHRIVVVDLIPIELGD